MTKSIKKWSDEADAKLQDCFASTDWKMFRDSHDGIDEYTTSVIGFIDDVIPTVTVSATTSMLASMQITLKHT